MRTIRTKSIRENLPTKKISKSDSKTYNDHSMFELSILWHLSNYETALKSHFVGLLNSNDQKLTIYLNGLIRSKLIDEKPLGTSKFYQLSPEGKKLATKLFDTNSEMFDTLLKLRVFSQIASISKKNDLDNTLS